MCGAIQQGYLFSLMSRSNPFYLYETTRELPDKVMEGESGWVLQGVLSRASFRRQRLSGLKHSRSCRYTLVTFTTRKVTLERSLSSQFVL